jgi:cation transport regulator ChaC
MATASSTEQSHVVNLSTTETVEAAASIRRPTSDVPRGLKHTHHWPRSISLGFFEQSRKTLQRCPRRKPPLEFSSSNSGFPRGRRRNWAALYFCCVFLVRIVESFQVNQCQTFALFRTSHRPSNQALRSATPRRGRVQRAMSYAGKELNGRDNKNSLDDRSIINSLSPMENSSRAADGEIGNAATSATGADAVWDPVKQVYVGGVIPEHESVRELLESSQDGLCVFGYGSLCWNPGQDGDAVLSHPTVSTSLGRVAHYRRCWAQRSTDHRGTPDFPGIVCTLLKVEEVQPLLPPPRRPGSVRKRHSNMDTLGRVYHVPSDLVEPCLNELDYREKGGYARDVIDVLLEDEAVSLQIHNDGPSMDKTVRALLYRGTLDNPAMWLRPLQDLAFAAGKVHRRA